MNYRVCVKRAKDDIIGELVRGTLNGSTGTATESSTSNFYITKNFLSVDYQHTYELVLLFRSNISYWICEYDSNHSYLNGHSIEMQDRNGNNENKEKRKVSGEIFLNLYCSLFNIRSHFYSLL